MDIKINALNPLFVYLKIILIFSLYPGKCLNFNTSEAEFKEFEPRLKFKPWLKYGWFHFKLYSIFQDLRRRSIETGFWQI